MSGKPISFPLTGGMDLVSAQIEKKPGMPIAALNYEPVAAGYRRLRGFERYNGMPSPNAAIGYRFNYDGNSGAGNVRQIFADDEIVRGSDGLTFGTCIADAVLVSGAWGTTGAVAYVDVDIVTANLSSAIDNLQVKDGALISIGYLNGVPVTTTAIQAAAVAYRRSNIAAITGSGPVRGVFFDGTAVLAIRDNAGATAGVFWKSTTTTGWAVPSQGQRLAFTSGGVASITISATITGATSGATATVSSVTLTSGSWAGGDAAGYLWVFSVTGVFVAENLNAVAQANIATIAAAPEAIPVIPAGGSYEFMRHNFYGASNLVRSYGVNGVGKAFVWDGATVSFITTGMTIDTPNHVAEHQGSLFLSFPGGSVQFSTVGDPLEWNPILGTGEIGVGSDVTALIPANKSTLGILAENSISVLYGHDSSDYQLEVLTDEAGGIAHSAQRIGQVVYLDNGGLRSLASSAQFGNFRMSALSQLIAPLLEDKRHGGINPAASWISREKTQYWLIFTDGTGICGFMGRKTPEFLPFNLGITVTCACSAEIDGDERVFLGASDGYVYEFDVGTSFDGSAIEHYLRLPFNNFGAPQIEKRAHKVILDIEVPVAATLSVSVDFDFGSVVGLAAQTLSMTVGGSAMTLGTGESYYAAQIESPGEVWIEGVAKSFSLKIAGSTSTETPHTLSAVTYLISARGLAR